MISKLKVNEDISLYQKNSSLSFGTDSYLLYAYIKSAKKEIACELGSGTGIISLLLAKKCKFKNIVTFEIQKELYDISQKNIQENGLFEIINPINEDIRNIDSSYNGRFDVVFSNPPYLKINTGLTSKDPSDKICCTESNGTIDDFCKAASKLLKEKGSFVCVYRPDRVSTLISSMKNNKLEPKRITFVHPRIDTPPCLVLCEGKKMGNEGTFVTKPLIIYSKFTSHPCDDDYTNDMKYIYENGEFDNGFRIP